MHDPRPARPFGLGTFSTAGEAQFPGLVLPCGEVVPLARLSPLFQRLGLRLTRAESVSGLFAAWHENLAALRAVADALETGGPPAREEVGAVDIGRLDVHAPLLPRQLFCTVANYRSHILETVRGPDADPQLDAPDTPESITRARSVIEERQRGTPYVCLKLPSTVIGPNEPLPIPAHARQTDWELELGVVIGTPCRRASRENAMSFVAGYTLVNDVTVRELVARPDLPRLGSDWLQSKNSPGFLPTGPFLIPAAFIADPYAIRLQLRLNGELMQNELTSDMIFDIAAQIEYISRHAQLLPGDIVCTGTPAGGGARYGRFLQPGDVLECFAEGFGLLRTPVVSEADSLQS